MSLCLPRGNWWQHRAVTITVARVRGKGPAIRQVHLSGQNIGRSLKGQQSILRRLRVVEEQCGNGIGTDDLGLRGKIPQHGLPESDQVKGNKRGTCQQQCSAADQHVHPCEFPGDGVFLSIEHVGQSPDRVFLLTAAATLSNSELKTSLALSAVAKLISKRILSPSTTNWIMPPRRENPGMSLTVRTPAWSIAARISFK